MSNLVLEEVTTLEDIFEGCQKIDLSEDHSFSNDLLDHYGNPQQVIYVQNGDVEVNGIQFNSPIVLPIVNGKLERIQCATLQDKKPVVVTPDSLAKGFAYYGQLEKNKPIIITYNLRAFYKIASCGFSVVLAIPQSLHFDFTKPIESKTLESVQQVIQQLSENGYKKLYLPCREEHIKCFQQLELNTNVRLLNQSPDFENDIYELDQLEPNSRVKDFIEKSIAHLPKQIDLPKGHLAKPMQWDYFSFHTLEDGLFKVYVSKDGEEKKTQVTSPILLLGEARSENNADWQKYIQVTDKDHIQHKLLIPYENLLGDSLESLRLLVNHGMNHHPPKQKAYSLTT